MQELNSPNHPDVYKSANPDSVINSIFDRLHTLETALNAIGYDAKASKKRRFPSRRQEIVLRGMTRALCVETVDPWKENRVRFFHPLLHDPQAKWYNLPFASPVSSMGGFDDCGLNWVPPAGSTLILFFEGGATDAPFYIGTTWHRSRGPGGRELTQVFPSREYDAIYKGHRKGYLVGPDDESQVLPPWNTESYNGNDIDQLKQFTMNGLEQQRTTCPNIYGFKTPEKHALKLVDGDPKCNRRWKRIEMISGCGNWMIFKDDHLHYGGQWANPKCPPHPGGGPVDICANSDGDNPYYSDFFGRPKEGDSGCGANILGGHPSTPCDPATKYCDSNTGSNPFFKHRNECRPYKGPGTPQNNRCDLPQTGIQFLSISGHSWVMDDSVEEPRGKPTWERSTESFDFGCNDKYLGRTYWKSATGHLIMMSDVEEKSNLRGKDNFIRLKSAHGNKIELNDHTIGEEGCKPCPPNFAGAERGIQMESTSKHKFKMIDHMNLQCGPCRKDGGVPVSKATKAFIQLQSGYGLEMKMSDDFSQEITQEQWIQIQHRQCVDPKTDKFCNTCDSAECRGPHILRFQGRPKGSPGIVFLRAGGHAIRQTYDMDIVLVGDKEKNPSDKFTYVSRRHTRSTEDVDFRYSGKLHILFAEEQILLMAGRDCPPKESGGCKGPCLYNVIVAKCPVYCPLTNILHWTEKAISDKVFASAGKKCGGKNDRNDYSEYDKQMAEAKSTCDSKTQDINTGAGNVAVPVQTPPGENKIGFQDGPQG